MKIIIIGAGQVGSTLAENLADEANDITLIDMDEASLGDLHERLDIRIVHGQGSHPEVLEQAGIADAEMLVAVTTHDEVNMIACQIAHSLYHTPQKIARIRSEGYTRPHIARRLFGDQNLPVDAVITPEILVTEHLQRLINQPGALQVLEFAEGTVQLVGVRAASGAPMVGKTVATLKQHIPNVPVRVAAIYRQSRAIIPTGSTQVLEGDEVFFLAATKQIRRVMSELAAKEKAYRKIIVAGGGNIGFRFAEAVEQDFLTKVIELDPARCDFLAGHLQKSFVLHGSGSDQDLLLAENIDEADVFLALTNNDAANIISSILAKKLGAGKVITLINNSVYVDMMQSSDLDIAVSPAQITTGKLLSFVRRGDTVRVYSLRRGAAEAMEVVAHGDAGNSRVVGRRIDEIALPEGATIGAVVRGPAAGKGGKKGQQVFMGVGDLVIEDQDHLVVFLADKSHTRQVERLFQVGVRFF
ncbi:MAG: Trk system potassium transporter TrkA [Cellvibrionales bacterium]|nr:Trk system potassium transporter TrkA [Cellvibrionales bacterium]